MTRLLSYIYMLWNSRIFFGCAEGRGFDADIERCCGGMTILINKYLVCGLGKFCKC